MNPVIWLILISAVYIHYLTARGTGPEFDNLDDTDEAIIKISDKECDKGECKGSECVCCPGYGVKESGLWFKSYSCQKCNCGEDVGCSFSWLGETCFCPAGYSYFEWFCSDIIFVQWFKALANFAVLTLVIAFTALKWLFFLLYFVAYFIILIVFTALKWLFFLLYYVAYFIILTGFTVVTWIFFLIYFLGICIFLIAFTAVKWLYSLLYNGAIILVICFLILPIILKIDYNDYLLLWYSLGRLFLKRLQERHKVHSTSVTENPNDTYNIICSLLKKIFELETNDRTENDDEIALKDFIYHCPICLGSQIEIVLDKGSLYTMTCGHIYCNSCIVNMEGTTTVTCAVCKETCKRENFQKIFLF